MRSIVVLVGVFGVLLASPRSFGQIVDVKSDEHVLLINKPNRFVAVEDRKGLIDKYKWLCRT